MAETFYETISTSDVPEIIYDFTYKKFFGLFNVHYYIEDRKNSNRSVRYKHFIRVRIVFTKLSWTFRSIYEYKECAKQNYNISFY